MEAFLQDSFVEVINMSITASYVILFVFIARLFLKKAPKIFSYSLWGVVLFRLICPFSFSSTFSFLKAASGGTAKMEYISPDIGMMARPQIDIGINGINTAVNASLPVATPYASGNPMQIILFVLSMIWALVIILLLLCSVISYLVLKSKVRNAMLVKDNVFECERIFSPFVLGIIKPKIYLPIGLKDTEHSYILKHEQTHIRRFDYLIKLLAFLVLCIHWFNPLVWISFVLMTNDMEMSCDELVLKELGLNIKRDYSTSLLSLAAGKRMISASPLAFGESNAKSRIKNVLGYKKPAFWVIIASVIAIVGVGVGCAANPKKPFDLEKARAAAIMFSTPETDVTKIGEAAFDHYYSSFMGEDILEEYRITKYKLSDISLVAGDEKEFCVWIVWDYSTASLYYLSANGNFMPTDDGYKCEGDGKEFRIKSLGNSNYQIVSIGTGGGAQGLEPAVQTDSASTVGETNRPANTITGGIDIAKLVEENLSIIMSSPKESSNPQDYINAHQIEYESILKYGGENALQYMLSLYKAGTAEGLRGHIIMRLCKELLGVRNNVTDETLSPQEWYNTLSTRVGTQ